MDSKKEVFRTPKEVAEKRVVKNPVERLSYWHTSPYNPKVHQMGRGKFGIVFGGNNLPKMYIRSDIYIYDDEITTRTLLMMIHAYNNFDFSGVSEEDLPELQKYCGAEATKSCFNCRKCDELRMGE